MNRMRIVFPVLIYCAVSFAQDQADPPRAPATKLGAFQSRTGVVLIRGYSTVGALRNAAGQYLVVVDAREFRDGSNPNSPKAAGVSITVKRMFGDEPDRTSYIDMDEIDSS
jgi:hypothetical protein